MRPKTLKEVNDLIMSGISISLAVKGFVDEPSKVTDDDVALSMVAEEPVLTGNTTVDAILGGLAEMIADSVSMPVAAWCFSKSRFLTEPAYKGGKHSRELMIESTPLAMSRRNYYSGEILLRNLKQG